MLIKTPQFIFIVTLVYGTILAISSSSWMVAWVGLEINLMSFIPLLINKLNAPSMETTIKYFLIQAMASMTIIFIGLLAFYSQTSTMITEINVLLTISLAMKAGAAPFHFWFPQVMEYAEWFQATFILTWQKIAPLILISFAYNLMVPIIIVSSSVIGMIGGMNQSSLKKILTYSSIIHSAWLIAVSFLSDSTWWLYFILYACLNVSVILPLAEMKITLINSINHLNLTMSTKMLMFLNLLSLAGLPPFAGFLVKLVSINLMLASSFNLVVLSSLIMSSLVAFYFYSRLMYSSFLMFEGNSSVPPTEKFLQQGINNFIVLSLMGNLFISFLVLLS